MTGTLDKFLMSPNFHIPKMKIVVSATPTPHNHYEQCNKVIDIEIAALLCDYNLMELQSYTLVLCLFGL